MAATIKTPGAGQPLLACQQKRLLDLLRSGRFWRWLLVAWLPGLCACLYRAAHCFSFGPVFLGAFIAAAVSAALVQSLITGVVVSNTGVAMKTGTPLRFWSWVLLLTVAYGLVIVAIMKA